MRRQLNEAVRDGGQADAQAAELFRHIRAYQFFRDCARWLGDGAFPWAREWQRPGRPEQRASVPPQKARRPPFSALFIDENLASARPQAAILRARISEIFSMLFCEDGFVVDVIRDPDGALPTPREDKEIGESIVDIDHFCKEMLPKRIRRAEGVRLGADGVGSSNWKTPRHRNRLLHKYDVIFCEVDYGCRFGGPQIVQKLASYLERITASMVQPKVPALIVLTHIDSIGHVQQCLNLSAHAFVNKERMYQVPSRMQRAVNDVQAIGDDGRLIGRERFGQHSNFRTLYSLRPDRTASLRNPDIRSRVIGGLTNPGAGALDPAERRGIPQWDRQDFDWIRSLPKSDLHCHFGTSITLRTIEALAFNTCGHLFTNWTPRRTGFYDVIRLVSGGAGFCELLRAAPDVREFATSRCLVIRPVAGSHAGAVCA